MSTLTTKPYFRRIRRFPIISTLAAAFMFVAALVAVLPAAAAAKDNEVAKRSYDLPAGDASATLAQFVEQSGEQVVYLVNKVRGVQTNAVKGEMTAREALGRMTAGTTLVVVQDEKTGALTVKRDEDPEGPAKNAGASGARGGGIVAPLLPSGTGAASATSEEEVVLSPFVVSAADEKDRYQATSTLAGTRVKTDLKDIASSISVVTSQFLRDTGATNNETLLVYTTNTEVGGVYGNYGGVGNTFVQGATDMEPRFNKTVLNTRIRGLDSADNTRDYFMTDIPWDAFNIGRVDIQRGPNSILFGIGSPAGIINSSINSAGFVSSYSLQNRLGSYGSVRDSLDVNQVIIAKELAIRVSALDDHTQYRQKPAFNKDRRIFAALRWDPELLKSDSASTSIRINYERGNVKANRPRILPPVDQITPWFDANGINKTAYDAYYVNPSAAGIYPDRNPVLVGEMKIAWFDQSAPSGYIGLHPRFTYDSTTGDPSAALQAVTSRNGGIGTATKWSISSMGVVEGSQIDGFPYSNGVGIAGYNRYAYNSNFMDSSAFPGAASGFYKDFVISDPTIFDFYNNLLDGVNKKEWQNWTAYNLSLEQTFLNNRLGIQLVYDKQEFGTGAESNSLSGISVDAYANANETLPWAYGYAAKYNGTGTAGTNANAGRAYVSSSSTNTGGPQGESIDTDRESFRATITGEVRATDLFSKSLLSDILGRHVFTGLYSYDTYKKDERTWRRYAMESAWSQFMDGLPAKISQEIRGVGIINYISAPLFKESSASGLHLPALQGEQSPYGETNVRYFDSHWKYSLDPADPNYVDPAAPWTNPTILQGTTSPVSTQSENPANYVGWSTRPFRILNADRGDIDSLYLTTGKIQQINISEGLTWQAFLCDDMIAGTYGWRRDTQKQRSAAGTISAVTGAASTQYGLSAKEDKVTGNSRSWGIVLHEPKSLQNKLPLGTNISLIYDEGENIRVQNRYDFLGRGLPNAKGTTKDYGFAINTLNDRLKFKVVWYKTEVQDANLGTTSADALGSSVRWAYQLPAWLVGNVLQGIAGMAGDPL
ncbi:MAG: TonB-dependent receptor plug domain-containing protein, partial [Opitutaceae bacterium]